jgi:exopolyphosphatase/guanosine-5'-triphosphate,3'-diphosphate pyrophosphatase
VARGLAALEQLTRDFALRKKPLRAVGTAVLRMTCDPSPFTRPAQEILGGEIEILDGEQEALLVGRGAIAGLPGRGPFAVADVGGQSLEVCRQERSGGWRPLSMPTGVVGLTERFLASDPPLERELEELRRSVRETLAHALPSGIEEQLVAVAGTATTLGMLELGLRRWERERVHGLELSRDRVRDWLAQITAVDTATRTARYGIRPGRADVFPAGLCVLVELLDHLGRGHFTVSANGLRIGAALSLLEDG